MRKRPTIHVPTPAGGWGQPWPNVAELETVLDHMRWTLVGGLMTQVHAVHRGIDAIRPTHDVDIVLHVETTSRVADQAADALESLGYQMVKPVDPRANTAHRFKRGDIRVDVAAASPDGDDVVDVLVADHAAPRTQQRLRGRDMVAIEGGTQALRRTLNAHMAIVPGRSTTISVPSSFAAAVLKAAAFRSDSRNPQRHLQDAAILLAAIEDPYPERNHLGGSDRSRLNTLRQELPNDAPEWRLLPTKWRQMGQAALHILTT